MKIVMNSAVTIPKYYLSDICRFVRSDYSIVGTGTMLLQFFSLDGSLNLTVGFSLRFVTNSTRQITA